MTTTRPLVPSPMLRVFAAILLIAGLLPFTYAFYVLLRFVVCAACAYTAYLYGQAGFEKRVWLFGLLAVLYNPVLPIYLTREIWFPIDIAAAIVIIWSVVREPLLREG